MTQWLRQHSATLGLLFVISMAILLGIGIGFILIVIGNLIRIW